MTMHSIESDSFVSIFLLPWKLLCSKSEHGRLVDELFLTKVMNRPPLLGPLPPGLPPGGRVRTGPPPPGSPHPGEPKLSKKARQRKGEYLKKLEEDNRQLKDTILQFEQKIATTQAQNEILSQQLQFFQGHLAGDRTLPPDPETA
jgi:hypothetical protein